MMGRWATFQIAALPEGRFMGLVRLDPGLRDRFGPQDREGEGHRAWARGYGADKDPEVTGGQDYLGRPWLRADRVDMREVML